MTTDQIGTPSLTNAEHMDQIYRYQRYIYDFTRKYYLLGRDHLIDELRPFPDKSVLEVGCGTGRNMVHVANQYPSAEMFGFDLSSEMLITARNNFDKADLSPYMKIAQADATTFDPVTLFGRRQFDRVFCSYTLSMIPPWRAALARCVEVLAPGGELHVVDFGQQEGLPPGFHTLLFAWLRQFSVHPISELRNEMQMLAEREGLQLDFTPLYRGYAWYGMLRKP